MTISDTQPGRWILSGSSVLKEPSMEPHGFAAPPSNEVTLLDSPPVLLECLPIGEAASAPWPRTPPPMFDLHELRRSAPPWLDEFDAFTPLLHADEEVTPFLKPPEEPTPVPTVGRQSPSFDLRRFLAAALAWPGSAAASARRLLLRLFKAPSS